MKHLVGSLRVAISVVALLLAGCAHSAAESPFQPIVDMHRHTPWPGQDDAAGLSLIREALAEHGVVAAALFITGREDVALYRSDDTVRFVLSPMFPCPALTDTLKWCFTEVEGVMPDPEWLDRQLGTSALEGIGELTFSYSAVAPDDPAMEAFWALAARHDVPAFVHTGRGPPPGEGPRRHPNCCTAYNEAYGNPVLLRPVLAKHPNLRVVLQHVGFDFLDETIALMRDYPEVYADMSVLNSVGPRELHDASLRRLVEAGLAGRIVLGSDDQDLGLVIARIEQAEFLTPQQRRGIYYDNAARFLRFDSATIARDYGRGR